jgi:hypothetical protein
MIDGKEREEIIEEAVNKAVERAMLMLPDTVGHLIQDHISMTKLNAGFYKDHPEFRDKKDVVAAVIEMVEGENPFDDYEDLLKKAIPKIKERIETMKTIDMKKVDSNPKRDFSNGEI